MSCIQAYGIYALINVKGGTCMDLSGGDNVSIIGYGFHQGPNQAWIFEKLDGKQTYYLRSAGSGQYLSVVGEPYDGQRLVASGSSYEWHVEDQPGIDSGVRLSPASNINFCVDLADNGNPTPGTPVQLWGRWDGQNQVWKLQKIQ
ncbi:carbohydrate-binding module family 13 protein [Boletus edulis BED1]|uniref:Carbohydrate-binding module family 13 protein n=1 Tax=Boletus edulis BED1 TaxID=1328754 RepID=A0AAD4BNR9_BOLED|nr:carbohydrate-binding module family 13 protein [Boletus edulis BED1]